MHNKLKIIDPMELKNEAQIWTSRRQVNFPSLNLSYLLICHLIYLGYLIKDLSSI